MLTNEMMRQTQKREDRVGTGTVQNKKMELTETKSRCWSVGARDKVHIGRQSVPEAKTVGKLFAGSDSSGKVVTGRVGK